MLVEAIGTGVMSVLAGINATWRRCVSGVMAKCEAEHKRKRASAEVFDDEVQGYSSEQPM